MDKKSILKLIISIVVAELVVGAITWNVYVLVKMNKQVSTNTTNIGLVINYLNGQVKTTGK
jgi:CHASE3 domain sensor protein